MAKKLNCKEEKKEPRDWRKVLIACAILVLLIAVGAFFVISGPKLFGFFVAGEQKAYVDTINERFNETREYNWTLQNVPARDFQLNSVKLSGLAAGNAKVYIVTDSGRLLIFDSSGLKTGASPLTAFAAAQENTPQGTETAQPGPPSSGETSSSPDGQPSQADTTSGPGAESSAPVEAPQSGEQVPAGNQTQEIPPVENQTPPTEGNVSEPENATNQTQELPPVENITNETNQTIEIPLATEIPFENSCEQTCYISEMLNKSSYTLQIELDAGAVLQLDSIYYQLTIENATNATNGTAFFATDIVDSNNNTIAATVEFVDPQTEEVEAIGKSEKGEKKVKEVMPVFQGAAVVEEQTGEAGLDIPKGTYKIKVKPQNMPITEITFDDIDITQNITDFIKLDDVPENATNLSNVVETYAIDPTAFEFTTATVTATAKGNSLFKCKDWDFANQTCFGNWSYLQSITPGEPYSFALTPEDPAYTETIQNEGRTNDSYVYQSSAGTNYGTADTVYIQSRSSSRNMRTFEFFNLSSIPSGATITSANLSLYKTGGTGSSTRTYNTYRVTASWTEAGITWTNQPAVAGSATSSTSVATGTNNVWKSWDVTSDVQAFVNGTYSNYGWRISDSSESSITQYASNFASEENANTTIRPELDIAYKVPPTTPTSITCNGGSCNNTFYQTVGLNCSGSTAGNETITYVIDAYYNQSIGSAGSTNVSTSCRTDTYTTGQDYEFYSKWTIPGSGNVTLTSFQFYDYDGTLSGSENIQMALYADGGAYSRLSEIVTITGAGAIGWISKNLTTPITITLGQTYWIAVGPSGSPSYSLARDAGADCSGYPPTGTGSYYQSVSGGLDSAVPTGASQSANKYIIPGITYTSAYAYTWSTIGNHTNGSTYSWNISGITPQSNVDLRCRATDSAGLYSNNYTGGFNLTISSAPLADTTPPTTTLVSPANGNVTTSNNVTFDCSATDNIQLKNITFYWNYTGNFIANGTDTITGTSNSTTISRTNLNNGNYNWNCYACDNSSNCAFAASNYTVTVNYTAPDTLAPTYSNDADNSSGSVYDNRTVAVSVYWQDNYQLSTATFRNNASGSWANVSNCSLSGTASWCNQTFNAITYAGKTICWNQYANDTTGNLNATMSQTIHCFNVISSDTTPPTVTINSPASNSLDGDGSVLFNCSATDTGVGLTNISLYIGGILNQTNSVTGASNSTTFSKTLANGNYTWYCRASDAAGNANNSATYSLQVNTAAVPMSSNFGGNTTNWAALPDLSNVCNGAAILEIPSYGQIQWYGCVNAASQNFNTYVNITNNFISVDFGLNPTFNSSAQLKLRGLNWSDTEDFNILINGEICGNTTCQNVTYENTTGTVTFDVGHFTNFSTNGTSTLLIWDQNDTGMPGGNRPACIGSSIDFYAYYYRTVLGFNLTNTGATCIINFTDSTGNSMTYNATSNYYQYARTFSSTGLKAYNASCVKTTVPTRPYIAVADSINITDCAPPQWSNNQSSYPAKYNASRPSIFNITWTDNANVSSVLIEGNWSGSPTNYSMNLISGTTANGVWNYSTTPLAAGNYYWKSYANDTSNSWNTTNTFTFTINKADNPTDLYLNGSKNQNVTIIYPAQSNATGTALVGNASLFRDSSPVSNPEIAALAAKPAGYNYTVSAAGNANYSANSTTYYLFVNKQPTAVDLYLNGNLNQNLTITYLTQSNATAVGYNGTVTLYRNGTSVGTSEIATFGTGYYNYTASIPDDTNRTGSSRTYFLNVTPAASTVQLLLDGSAANKTVEVGSTVNQTVVMITPSTGSVQLYRNGSLIQSGSAPITNLSTFSTLGAYNMTAVYPATTNYSTSADMHYVITQDTTKPNVYLTSPSNNTAIKIQTQSFIFNATDNYYTTLNCTLYINNVASGTNASVTVGTPTSITNTTIPEGNDLWYVNCTDGSGNTNQSETRVLTVDLTPPTIVHVRPVQNDIVGYNVTLDIDVTDALTSVGSAWYEISNSSGIMKSGTLPGPAYQDVWNSKTVQDGNYTFRAYANDTLGNQANSSVNFTVDNTAPFIQILRPLNNSKWNINFNLNVTIQNTRINASTYNITNSTGAVVQSGSNNSINSPTFAWTDLVNVNILPSGVYVITVYALDSIGYTTIENSTFIIDKISPQYSNLIATPASPVIYSPTQTYEFNATWTDNVAMGAVIFEFNGTNYTVTVPSGSIYSKNFTGLNFGNYSYKWYANDTAGNWNSTGTFTYTVNKAPTTTSLYLNGTQGNLTVTYPTQTNATAVTSAGSVTLYRNGSNVGTSEVATLAAGMYNYTAVNTGDSNYIPSSETWFLTVNKAMPAVNLLIDGAPADKSVIYPTQTNATAFEGNTGDSDVTYTLFRNATTIGSGSSVSDIATLGVNTYVYTYNTSGGTNYTANTINRTLTVGKQTTAVDLFLNGSQNNLTITYGTQSNATAIGYNGTVTLYRNGTSVGTQEVTTLAAGYYNYTATIPDDLNKTGSSKTFFLTVNKAAGNITLLLNGTNNDFSSNRSQSVNITGIRVAGEGTLSLYDNGTLINSGAPVITNITPYSALGIRNITLSLPETQNYTAATSTHFLSVYGILYSYLTVPTGMPKYYEGQNITFKGYVRDELANPIDGATVTFESINSSYVYVCSSSLGEGSGIYNCTHDTTGMASPKTYDVRINATKAYYYTGTYTNSSVFLLESGQKANLILHKIPSVQAINSSQITYNVTLYLANGRGTSENTILKDPDANQTWNESTIFGAQTITESYLLIYNRGSTDSQVILQKANATGYDPFYNISLFVESNQPIIVIPQNITGAQLTLIKNIVFVNQTTTNITYTISDMIVNSGGSDLTNIAIVDSDIGLTTTANLTRGNSATYSGNKTIAKNSQSYTYNFTQTSAFANSQFFYSNQPAIQIPGYGGPYDVIIDSLPASVTAGSTITGVVKAINMNPEISEDRTLTTWIQDSFGNITALDVRTIFIGRNQSATATITLTVPSTPGTYLFVSKLTWPTADANASKAFDVTSAVVPPIPGPAAPPGGVIPPTNITLPPGVPQDIIDSLIELRNVYNEIKLKNDNLNNILKAAEDAAARGNYELARNLLKSAYGQVAEIQLELCGKTNITMPKAGITLPALPSINMAQFFGAKWLWWILATTLTVIFIIALIIRRSEEMALEAELLREERTHLERLYDKVSDYLNRKITKGDKNNGV